MENSEVSVQSKLEAGQRMATTTQRQVGTANTSKNNNNERLPQRIVLLPGPHKTGTTSVQSFLVSLMKKKLLGNWEWPASSSKAFAGVAHSVLFHDSSSQHGNAIHKKAQKLKAAWSGRNHSIVLGAELFDYVAALPPDELPHVFDRFDSLLPWDHPCATPLETVVMYRTPRSSHLVSAWKQQIAMAKRSGRGASGGGVWRRPLPKLQGPEKRTRQEPPSLAQFLCHGTWHGKMEFYVDKIVASQVNPMGVAHAWSQFGRSSTRRATDDGSTSRSAVRVTLGDMSNMTDIATTVVCEVLGIPCITTAAIDNDATNASATASVVAVLGLHNKTTTTKPKVLNQRDNPVDLELSNADMEEVEKVLRQMDCFYYCNRRQWRRRQPFPKDGDDSQNDDDNDVDDDELVILHAKDEMFTNPQGWNNCCASPETFLSPAQAYARLQEIGCRASGLAVVPNVVSSTEKVATPPSLLNDSDGQQQQQQQQHQGPNVLDMKLTVFDVLAAGGGASTASAAAGGGLAGQQLHKNEQRLYLMCCLPVLSTAILVLQFLVKKRRRRRRQSCTSYLLGRGSS